MFSIRKKHFKTAFEAMADDKLIDKYIASKTTATFEDWLKSQGHTIGSIALTATDMLEKEKALKRLRSFLDAKEPQLVYFLQNMWRLQGKAITYKEIREALLNGDIDQSLLYQWNEDYARFVVKHMQPAWENAIRAGAARIEAMHPEYSFDPFGDGVKTWTENRSAAFVTNSTETQIKGLRAVVRRAAVLEDMDVDQLARAIRAMVGLTQQQTVANMKYYENLIAHGTSEQRALDLSIRYSARQHRFRGYNIARTELAFAYNQGSYEGIKQAQERGYMGEVAKVWVTAKDERVCSECGGLDLKVIALDDDFDFKTKLSRYSSTIKRVPPAHPGCRCGVIYKEIKPPQK